MKVNPFANPNIVAGYEAWYVTIGRRVDRLEKALLEQLLADFPRVHTMLEMGCGTGHFTRWFDEQGLRAIGLDLSPAMLAEVIRLDSPRRPNPIGVSAVDLLAMRRTCYASGATPVLDLKPA